MPYSETDLRTVMTEHCAAAPGNPDRYAEVRRRVRQRAARRTAGTACLLVLVVAVVATGVLRPWVGFGDETAVVPRVSLVPGSEPVTLLPVTFNGLPLDHGAQFELADKHRARLTFTASSNSYLVVIVCEAAGLVALQRIGVDGAGGDPLDGFSTSGCAQGRPSGFTNAVGGGHDAPVTLEAAIFPSETFPLSSIPNSDDKVLRLLTSAPWPDRVPATGSWAIGVYGTGGATPDWDTPVATWKLPGTAPAVETRSRPVTLLPERYRGGLRASGEQYPADGTLRRVTFVPQTPTTGLVFGCARAGVWWVQRLPNGQYVLPRGCESKGVDGLGGWAGVDAWPDNTPGEPVTLELAVFPPSVPIPKTKAALAKLLNDPPRLSTVEWAIGAYDITNDGP